MDKKYFSLKRVEGSLEIDDYDPNILSKTIMKWYRTYCSNNGFRNENKLKNKSNLPPLLESNPEVKEAVINYCNENLSTLSGELLHHYITEKCIPSLLSIR